MVRFARLVSTAAAWFGLIIVLLVVPVMAQSAPAAVHAPESSQSPQPPTATSQTSQAGDAGQAYHLPPDKLEKAKTLNRIRLALDISGAIWGLAVLWLLLATRAVAALASWTERVSRRAWIQGVLFFVALTVITSLAAMPLDAMGHAASVHYGIGIQRWPGWLGDQAKGLGLSVAVGTWVLLLFNLLVRRSPRRYWIWAWAISIPLILAAVFVTPVIIDPLFNKFEPLSKTHPALVGRLQQVVARTGTQIPNERMFLMKASEKTNAVNAYVTGIGATKRFVMWDTTTDRLPDDEVLFIFGHESGHYQLHHIAKGLAISFVGILIMFWACARVGEWLVRRNGSRWGADSIASRPGFVALLFTVSIAGFLATPLSNTMSRAIEHEADVYGQEAVHGLVPDPQKTAVSGFNHLGEISLDDPNPSPLVEFWMYSHPSVQHRATFAAHYDPWANGGRGRFFAK